MEPVGAGAGGGSDPGLINGFVDRLQVGGVGASGCTGSGSGSSEQCGDAGCGAGTGGGAVAGQCRYARPLCVVLQSSRIFTSLTRMDRSENDRSDSQWSMSEGY